MTMAPSSSQKDVPEKAENAVAKGRIFSTTQAASMRDHHYKVGKHRSDHPDDAAQEDADALHCLCGQPRGGGIRKNAIAAITPSARQTMRFLLMLDLLTNPYRNRSVSLHRMDLCFLNSRTLQYLTGVPADGAGHTHTGDRIFRRSAQALWGMRHSCRTRGSLTRWRHPLSQAAGRPPRLSLVQHRSQAMSARAKVSIHSSRLFSIKRTFRMEMKSRRLSPAKSP